MISLGDFATMHRVGVFMMLLLSAPEVKKEDYDNKNGDNYGQDANVAVGLLPKDKIYTSFMSTTMMKWRV